VYPHPRCGAVPAARTLKYKAKPGRGLDQLKSELLLLMDGLEKLTQAVVPLLVDGPDWVDLRRRWWPHSARATCAARKIRSTRRLRLRGVIRRAPPDRHHIYGDVATGYIVTPSLPCGCRTCEFDPHRPLVDGCEHVNEIDQRRQRSRAWISPFDRAETTEPSTAQISVQISSICTTGPIARLLRHASARCRRLRRIESRRAGSRVTRDVGSYRDISCSASPGPDTSPQQVTALRRWSPGRGAAATAQ